VRLTNREWDRVGDNTRAACEVAERLGLRCVFHHGAGTYIETPDEISRLIEATGIGLCLDTGHYRFGGGDPVDAVRAHADRIRHVHFKDCHPDVARQARAEGWEYNFAVGKGLFCELGQGEVDFPAVLAALKEINYNGWIVIEQDVLPSMGTPKEAAQRNRDYLRSIGI
jgi:inosose dehydratase